MSHSNNSLFSKVEEISKSAEEYRTIFERLFPGYDVSSLLSLPRQDLLRLLSVDNHEPTSSSWPSFPPPHSFCDNPEAYNFSQFSMEHEGFALAHTVNAGEVWDVDEQHAAYSIF